MGRFLLVVFLTLTFSHRSDTFILPLKTANGSLDLEHLVGHMTFLEQTVTSFQQTVTGLQLTILGFKQTIQKQDADIAVLKTEIANLKANQQASNGADLVALKTEISNLRQDYQNLSSHMKTEVNAAKMEMTQMSHQVTSLATKFNNLTFSWQAMSDQNMTGTVHTINDTLTRVLGRVQRADNDRVLLRSSVNTLNKTVSTLSNNLAVKTTALSAEIEVGFNIFLGSSSVNLQASAYTSLKFQDIQYNKGDGYNTTTGVFTAPVSGTYLLWTQVYKEGGKNMNLYLKKGNSFLGYSYTPSAAYVSGSVITTASITAGEQVSVYIHGADRVSCCYFSSFGGTLLYRH